MKSLQREAGFTLVEVLVAISLFSIISIGIYSVMFSGIRSGETTENIVTISSEARFGINRMIRDVREAQRITAASPTSFTVEVDFDGDGLIAASAGEIETFTLSGDTITLNGEVLMEGVSPLTGAGAPPLFDYSSNVLQYDTSPNDGVTTWQELDRAPPAGVDPSGPNGLDAAELPFLTNITFSMGVTSEDRSSNFFAEAQLRNKR